MAAPTPISAYLHSATMVKAGVYLLGRFAPVFALTAPWRPLVLTVGLVTMIAGGLRALRQYDLKLLLAFGTVSQLGFLVVLFGAGTAGGDRRPAITVIVAHALFKAALFMVVGMIDHQTGTRDVRLIPPLGAGWGAVQGGRRAQRGVDGRRAAARRVHGQGVGLRRRSSSGSFSMSGVRARRPGRRLGADLSPTASVSSGA